jgi:hypothetical protein
MIRMTSIYNPKTKFLILDIETTKQEGYIFDIAFSVYSRQGGTIGSAGYIIKENETRIPWYTDRLTRYEEYKKAGKYKVENFVKVMAIIEKIIDKYQIEYATAYNSGFDFSKIEEACKVMKANNPLKKVKELDLYNMAAQTLGQQKWFKEFIEKNNLKTEKGNRKSGAEAMYAYMIMNADFEEEHTGLADIAIETEILDRVLRQKKKMNTNRNQQAWRLVQG